MVKLKVSTLFFLVATLFSVRANAWGGPPASPPNSNVSAPINVGSSLQIKTGELRVQNAFEANSQIIWGNLILSGSTNYLNFGTTVGSSGYGLRNNNGTLEFKNSGGSWSSFASGATIPWITSGNNIYNTNAGNVGIGAVSPGYKLHVQGAIAAGTSDIYFTDTAHNHTGIGNTAGYAAIENAVNYNTLMILGRAGGIGGVRSVSIWDRLDVNGNAYASAFLYSSDARLKSHVRPLEQGLTQLLELKPVSFAWNAHSIRSGEEDIGFIAQEVEKVLPIVVHTDENAGFKSIDYPKLVPILVKAIQEQQEEIEALKADVAALKAAR